MDKHKLERIKQICFDEKKPGSRGPTNRFTTSLSSKALPPQTGGKQRYGAATSKERSLPDTGKLEIRRSKLSEDSSIERMKARSRSRDLKFQEKMQRDQNKSVINRQPANVLKKMGAYRSIGRSQNLDSFFSPDTGNKTLQPSVRRREGSWSRGSQEVDQSLFLRFQDKSQNLEASPQDQSNVFTPRVGTAAKQLNHTTIAQTSMAGRMKQIQMQASRSRSASKSKSANRPRRGQNQGTQLKMRQMEDQISTRIKSKQEKLQTNLDAMKERMRERGKAQESQLLNDMSQLEQTRIEHVSDEVDNSNFILFSRPSKPASPFADAIVNGIRGAFTPEKNIAGSIHDLSRASPSPPSFRRQHQQASAVHPLTRLSLQHQALSQPSQIFGPENQSMSVSHFTGLAEQPPDPRFSTMGAAMMQTINNNLNTCTSGDQANMAFDDVHTNLYSCKGFIEYILNMVQATQKELGRRKVPAPGERDVEILEFRVIQELKLKLSGAFERLEALQDDYNSQQQILSILQNFLNDIFMKIQKSMSTQDQDVVIRSRIVYRILQALLGQLSQMTFNASLPSVASSLHSLRTQLALQLLSSLHSKHEALHSATFFKNLCMLSADAVQTKADHERKLGKYHAIFSKLKQRQCFNTWRFDYLNLFRLQKQRIQKSLLQYNKGLAGVAASVFNKEYKGLANFARMTEDLVAELLKSHNRNRAHVDILLVNKSQKMACAFVKKDGELKRYEYDVVNQESLLRVSVRAARGSKAQYYVNPFYDRRFNIEVDVPLKLEDRREFASEEEGSQRQSDASWVYFLFPIVERDFEKVKMVIRYAYKDEGEQCLDQMARYTIQVLQREILESFSQFKQIIRDFTEMEARIAETVKKQNAEDKALEAVKFIERANQELSQLHEENNMYKQLYEAVKHQNMKPSEVSRILGNQRSEGTEGKHFYSVDESLMRCTNNEHSVNDRYQGKGQARDAAFLSKGPSQQEGSSSIGLMDELNHAAVDRAQSRNPWNYGSGAYGSVAIEKEAISPISIVQDKTIAENTEQSSERYDLNLAAKELMATLGEGPDNFQQTKARQRLVQRLDNQTTRNYRKSKSFDELHSQQDINCTSEQNQTISKETERSRPSGKLYNKRQRSQMKRIYKQLRVLRVKQQNAERLLGVIGKYGGKVQNNLKDKVYQDWVQKFKTKGTDGVRDEEGRRCIYIEDNKSRDGLEEDADYSPTGQDDEERLNLRRCRLLRKICNRQMKIYFDVFAIKSFQNYIRGYRILRQGGQIGQLRNLLLQRLLIPRLQNAKRTAFEKYYASFEHRRKCLKKLSRVLRRRENKAARDSLGRWRAEAAQHQRQFVMKLKGHYAQQQEEALYHIFAVNLMKETSDVFKPDDCDGRLKQLIHLQPSFSTFRDFLNSPRFIHMMQRINEHLMHSLRSQRFSGKSIEITDIVYNLQIPSLSAETLQASDEFLQLTFSVLQDPEKSSKHIKTHLHFLQSGKADQLIAIIQQNSTGFYIPFKHFDKSVQRCCIQRKVHLASQSLSSPSISSQFHSHQRSVLSNSCPAGKNLFLTHIRSEWTQLKDRKKAGKAVKEEAQGQSGDGLSGTMEVYVANQSAGQQLEMEEAKYWLNLIEKHADRMGHSFRGTMTELVERVGAAQRLRKE